MALTKAELEQDLEMYRANYARLLADLNAIKGVIQYIEQKLARHALSAPSSPVPDLDLHKG